MRELWKSSLSELSRRSAREYSGADATVPCVRRLPALLLIAGERSERDGRTTELEKPLWGIDSEY